MPRVPQEAREIRADITGPQPGTSPERPVSGRGADWRPDVPGTVDPRTGGRRAPGAQSGPGLVGGTVKGAAD